MHVTAVIFCAQTEIPILNHDETFAISTRKNNNFDEKMKFPNFIKDHSHDVLGCQGNQKT